MRSPTGFVLAWLLAAHAWGLIISPAKTPDKPPLLPSRPARPPTEPQTPRPDEKPTDDHSRALAEFLGGSVLVSVAYGVGRTHGQGSRNLSRLGRLGRAKTKRGRDLQLEELATKRPDLKPKIERYLADQDWERQTIYSVMETDEPFMTCVFGCLGTPVPTFWRRHWSHSVKDLFFCAESCQTLSGRSYGVGFPRIDSYGLGFTEPGEYVPIAEQEKIKPPRSDDNDDDNDPDKPPPPAMVFQPAPPHPAAAAAAAAAASGARDSRGVGVLERQLHAQPHRWATWLARLGHYLHPAVVQKAAAAGAAGRRSSSTTATMEAAAAAGVEKEGVAALAAAAARRLMQYAHE
ncbi:MAG: hypothetical protein M1826_002174 [Phylliscum demangeonii]|nr:MAG: hypothetical protein M1826_002174 [Phylliscum demangeonii]